MDEVKKEAIIDAAFQELMEGGLPALSYDLVAGRSGLSRQLIRYYFPNRDELMIALCDRLALAYRQALVALASKPDISDRLNMILDFYFDLLDENSKPRDDQVYDAVMCFSAGNDIVRNNLRTQYGMLGNVVSQEITIKYPGISSQDADQLSYLFVCLMYGHWKMVASLGTSEEHKFITRRAVDRLIASYRAEPSPKAEHRSVWSAEPK